MTGPAQQKPAGPAAARLETMREGVKAAEESRVAPVVLKKSTRAAYELAVMHNGAITDLLRRMDEMERRCE